MIRTLASRHLADTLDALRDSRSRGEVMLVVDPRMPAVVQDALTALAHSAQVAENVAWAALSGGTTGTPRVVLRSDSSWHESFAVLDDLFGDAASGGIRLPAPPASSLTLFSLAHALAGGPQPHDAGSVFHGTPHSFQRALDDHPQGISVALIGGAYLDPTVHQRAQMAGITVCRYYGAAELSFVALDTGDGLQPFPGVEIEIREGVIWVRSPYVAEGYLGSDGALQREGSWVSVGDRAQWRDGTLHLLGRSDDAVITAGATVVPAEVEAMICRIPGVRDAAVFALDSSPLGSMLAALVDGDLPLESIRDSIRHSVSSSHQPRQWFAGAVPRTLAGKVDRGAILRDIRDGNLTRFTR